ncbi:MAG: PAS domain S-box protein [Candidatus Methylomirabilales bacterium]
MRATPSTPPSRAAPADEAARLQHGLQALAGLLAPPADAPDPTQALLARLTDTVVTVLALDLAYARWSGAGSSVQEAARVRHGDGEPATLRVVRAAVAPWLPPGAVDRVEILDPWGTGTLALVPVAAGDGALCLLAGSRRSDFADPLERTLLGLAAAQAALALERAALAASLGREAEARRQAEAREQELGDFFEHGPMAMHWVGPDGRILRASQAELDLLGYAREEYVGRHIAEFHADAAAIQDILERLKRGETLRDYPARLRAKDGSIRQVLLDSNVRREAGRLVHSRCFTRDVTAGRRTARRLALQQAVSHVLAESASLAAASPRLLQALCERLDWEAAVLWRVDEMARQLTCVELWQVPGVAATGFAAATRAARPDPAAGLPGRVWAEGQPVWIPDAGREPGDPRLCEAARAGPRAAFGFPIRSGEAVLGVIECLSHESAAPDQDLLDALDTIGHQLGQFIQRKRAEEAAGRSKARKAAIVESALDAIVFLDHAGTILDFNAAAEKTFGYARSQAVGRPFADLIVHPAEREGRGSELARYLLTDEAVLLGKRLELPAYRADGSQFPAELAITRLPTDGPAMFAGFLRDISERKWLERVLKQRAQELAEADRRKTEFLAMLAHELRNPLAPIRNGVDLLRRLLPPEPRLAQIRDMIDRQAVHMARLIDDLLDLARVSRGKLLLRREAVEMGELVRQALQDQGGAAEAKGLSLAAALPPAPIHVAGDRTRLAQALGNLLSNAIKFTPAGGRVAVRLGLEPGGSRLCLTVEDTGIGMAQPTLATVFEPFSQVDVARDQGQGGLGLGLALVKGLIELHGGEVAAASPGPDQGSTFTLRLPVAPPGQAEGETAVEQQAAGPARRILVIEDKPDAAESMRLLLEAFGHHVAVAHTGQAGVDLAREFHPEVVLCDIGLPRGMDGYAVARALRQDASRAYLIALTGYGQEEDQRRAREAGFDLHLTKPVDPRALEPLLARLPRPEAA